MRQLPEEQKRVVHEVISDLEASIVEVRAAVDQNTEALVQHLQHLQAKASDAIAFVEDFEDEAEEGVRREHRHDHRHRQ